MLLHLVVGFGGPPSEYILSSCNAIRGEKGVMSE